MHNVAYVDDIEASAHVCCKLRPSETKIGRAPYLFAQDEGVILRLRAVADVCRRAGTSSDGSVGDMSLKSVPGGGQRRPLWNALKHHWDIRVKISRAHVAESHARDLSCVGNCQLSKSQQHSMLNV